MIQPKLRLFDLTMIVLSMVIGIGIFRNPAIIAREAGSEPLFFLAWVAGALVSLCGALVFAEIGSRLPLAGGYYKLFTVCYHPAFAFMLIWMYIMLNAGSGAAVAITGAQYITPVLLPPSLHNATGERIMFFALTGVLYVLNISGIRMGAHAQNVLSIVKVLLLLFLAGAIFLHPAAPVQQPVDSETPSNWVMALGAGLIGVFFTYGGYQNSANLGADVQHPQKNIPRGILLGIGIVMVLYLLINYVYVAVIGFENVKHSPLIAADVARLLLGEKGSAFASVVIFISALGFLNAELIYNPRVMYAMAEEKILPRIFMKVHARRQVQEFALTVHTLLIVLFFLLLQNYGNLLNYVMFNDTVSLAFASACIFILRRREKLAATNQLMPAGYRIRWYPFIPAVFIGMMLFVTFNVIVTDPRNAFIGFLIMLLGYPVFLLLKSVNSVARG